MLIASGWFSKVLSCGRNSFLRTHCDARDECCFSEATLPELSRTTPNRWQGFNTSSFEQTLILNPIGYRRLASPAYKLSPSWMKTKSRCGFFLLRLSSRRSEHLQFTCNLVLPLHTRKPYSTECIIKLLDAPATGNKYRHRESAKLRRTIYFLCVFIRWTPFSTVVVKQKPCRSILTKRTSSLRLRFT